CETNLSTEQAGPQTPPRLPCAHGDGEWPESYGVPPRERPQASVRVNLRGRFLMCAALPTLKKSQDFKRVAASGLKRVTPAFILQVDNNTGHDGLRLGLTVSRKVGTAVTRYRAKRRLREMVRLQVMQTPLRARD